MPTIPHAWDGNELIVPESAEDDTDDIVAQVEMRLGIASDGEVEVPPREAIPLADDAASTEYDLAEWESDERELITSHLVARGLPFRWEEDVLLVGTEDEELVDTILDEVENDEGVELPDDDDDADDEDADRLPFETLDDVLPRRRPIADATHSTPTGSSSCSAPSTSPTPTGRRTASSKRLWVRTCELADELAAALVDGDEPDVSGDAGGRRRAARPAPTLRVAEIVVLLAELEVWHSRPVTPTRRVSLGHLVLAGRSHSRVRRAAARRGDRRPSARRRRRTHSRRASTARSGQSWRTCRAAAAAASLSGRPPRACRQRASAGR